MKRRRPDQRAWLGTPEHKCFTVVHGLQGSQHAKLELAHTRLRWPERTARAGAASTDSPPDWNRWLQDLARCAGERQPAWLAKHLGDPQIAIIEVDEDTTAYGAGHIPGAVGIDWAHDLHAAPQRDFVSAAQLAELLGGKGVSSDQRIVLYGGNNNWFAAYAYWLFKLRGIDDVALLNGGRKKWELEQRPLTPDTPEVAGTTFVTGAERPELRIFRDEVVARARVGRGMLVDVRSPDEFSGKVMAPPHLPQEQPYVAWHIPGASNVPWSKAANEDGTFKAADDLLAIYGSQGMSGDGEVITYCRIGERSSHTWFVLSELLGYTKVRNYDGSWTEYGSMVGVPVER